ncbi:MAG: type IV pilus modification PilV family protein [Coraliomargarita sp.]
MDTSQKNKQGFSLVEVMIAMVIISFFAAGVYGTLILSSKIYYSGRDIDEANLILQYEIENLRGLRWEDVERMEDSKDLESPSLDAYGDTYTLSRAINTKTNGMAKVTYTVSWTGRNGSLRELSSGEVAYTEEGLSDSYYREY